MNPFIDSRDLALLEANFRQSAEQLLAACGEKGARLRPFFTVRGPVVQAKLWCQSRNVEQILRTKTNMVLYGAPWLASLLDPAHAATGHRVTNALPGLSWHQWGEAIDCFVYARNGSAVWSPKHPDYGVYAEEAKKLGLEPGALWSGLPDAVHVQKRPEASPLKVGIPWPEIEAEMKRRF